MCVPTTVDDDRLDAVFAALADPTRRRILSRLTGGDLTVGELAAPFRMSLQAVSQHLTVLDRAGLIERGRDGRRRPCRLVPGTLDDAQEWIATNRRQWAGRLDRLTAHLLTLPAAEPATEPIAEAADKETGR
jgi:DNA-binding transcriptional ArsR family regulator